MKLMEAERLLTFKRGNVLKELAEIGETMSEGTEIQSVTLFKLFQNYEKVMKRMNDRLLKPQHVVVKYNYTMEGQREFIIDWTKREGKIAFERIFQACETRIHAIFNFLALLELTQQKFLTILIGEGRNNFILEWNPDREEDETTLEYNSFH
jgi:segregation and condensation protein A